MVGVPRLPMPLPKATGQWERMSLLPYERDTGSGQLRPAVPQVIQDVLSGLAAPGNALRGQYNQVPVLPNGSVGRFDPRMMMDAANLAGTIGVSGMSVPKLPNTLGMFGGEMAKTADRAALATAKQMAEHGASRDAIWNATGWFQGVDGKWRFEIPDNQSAVNTNAAGFGTEMQTGPMARAIQHGRLYAAYPELADLSTSMRMRAGDIEGSYAVPRTVGTRLIEGISMEAPTAQGLQSGLLHEGQHAIQRREGFARGGSQLDEELDQYSASIAQAAEDVLEQKLADINQRRRKLNVGPIFKATEDEKQALRALKLEEDIAKDEWRAATTGAQYEAYRRLAGEVEARNVQARKDLTPEQRRAKAPWLTQDVPDDRQIVRF